jgi:nucleotide-binding universal stress UspA family protein
MRDEPNQPTGASPLSPKPTDKKVLLEAQRLSQRWGERLDNFELPCPICQGDMEFQGVLHDRLYEFAEGEPGVINPLNIYPMSFVCNRCGYTAEFDAELFNPAHLAHLQGAETELVEDLSVRDFRILVALKGDERSDTLLDLATAIAGNQHGEVIVVDIGPFDALDERQDERLQHYRPRIGDPAPVRLVREVYNSLDNALIHISERERCRMILIEARHWAIAQQKIGVEQPEAVLDSITSDVAVVYDHGLHHTVRRILLVTSGGPHTKIAVMPALQLAQAFDAQLDILYVASPQTQDAEAVGRRQIANTLEHIEIPEGLRLQERVIIGKNPIETIIAEAPAYDLLILGASPRSWRGKVNAESSSAKIARNSGITSIVIRARNSRIETLFKRLFGIR